MNKHLKNMIIILIAGAGAEVSAADIGVSPNGIAFPTDYINWTVISTSHRVDNKTLRVILGDDIAAKAARSGQTNPWPQGAMLAKVVWKEGTDKHWPAWITRRLDDVASF